MEPWLWFPVLADVPGIAVSREELVASFDGSRGNGKTGAWSGLETGDENFLFSCPNNEHFTERVFALYSALLDRLDLGGVMLDRIRFPSPANGFEMLFSCFCDSCARQFMHEEGRPLSALADRAAAFLQRTRQLTGESFSSEWRSTDTLLSAAGLASLAGFRGRSILRVVESFSRRARSRGLKIGLDLFSPSLAGMVGQDYLSLSSLCDWIKPMIYCHARGPAGFPLEAGSLLEALRKIAPLLGREEAAAVIASALHLDVPTEGSFPPSTITHELDMLERMHLPPSVGILAGIEAVRLPRFGIEITDSILAEALSLLSGRAHGLVASWNLLHIPDANLRRIRAFGPSKGGR